ncbi:hypothetical protein BC834DRAFT_970590 [Gloeopeniophorella convolvens]|nr:hypothetical protein BC834DRAFT_970590 [Gloeopeniophorella convolvens]
MSLSDLDAIPRHSYIQVAALSFLYYDHVLTFPAEVSRMWSQPISKNTLLFFLNRYVAFLGNIAVAVITFAGVSTTHEVHTSSLTV